MTRASWLEHRSLWSQWRRNRQLRRNFHRTDHRRPPSPPSLNRLPAPLSYIAINLKKVFISSLEIITKRAIEKLKLLNEVLVVAEENVVRRQELIKSSYADWVMRRSLRTCIKNLFGSDGVTRSSEAGESCRRKNSVSMSVKAGLHFPLGRITRNLKKYVIMYGSGAPVYLAAILRYLHHEGETCHIQTDLGGVGRATSFEVGDQKGRGCHGWRMVL
ncbi:unnamed protein product [Brassica napus]|uniref:(rape) hypothetical protein n=1 Tax=Brassica napus TaxID=3708 RepID=A0A816JTU0_BRANA|nr:unnamed protein product [Brassica napus]